MFKETLLGKVLRQIKEDVNTNGEEDNVKLKRNKVEAIRHTPRAFSIGDKILYWRSVSGKPSSKFYATVKSFDGTTLTIDENGVEKTIASNSPNILSNSSWIIPLKNFMHGSDDVPTFNYKLDYETDEDGNIFVTITDGDRQKKYFYNYSDGKLVKSESTNRVHVSKWYIKEGQAQPVKIDPSRATGDWKPVEEDWFVINKKGLFWGWQSKKYKKITEAFPWLYDTPSKWKSDTRPDAVIWCPSQIKK